MVQDDRKHYEHGPLETGDIEGATPNNLWSQALKNRQKGKILKSYHNGNLLKNSLNNKYSLEEAQLLLNNDEYHSP